MNEFNRANLLTPKQAAEYLQIKVQTLATWRNQGKGPKFCKVGRAVRYRPQDLETYITSDFQRSSTNAATSPSDDERLRWSVAGFFVRQGPPGSTLVWGAKDYCLADLQLDKQGHFILFDQHGQRWKLLHRAVYHLNFIQFNS